VNSGQDWFEPRRAPHDGPVPGAWAEPGGSASDDPPVSADHRQAAEPGAYWSPDGGMPLQRGRPRKRHARLIVALCAVGLVVLFGVDTAVNGVNLKKAIKADKPRLTVAAPSPVPTAPSSSPAVLPHSIEVPRSFGDFVRMSGDIADRTARSVRKQAVGRQGRAFAKAKIGLYKRRAVAGPEILFFGFSASDTYIAEQLRELSPSEVADSFFFGTHSKNYPAGPLGGVLRCAKDTVKGRKEAACVWVDDSVVGMVFDAKVPDPVALARIALSLRNAAEH
jgi:hypothetical protein